MVIVVNVVYSFLYFNIKEFDTTDIEDRAIAPAAIIGERSHPVNGYKTPAAIGIPKEL